MSDDVIVSKAAIIGRCIARVREEYAKGTQSLVSDLTRREAALLNIQRAFAATLDMGKHIVRREGLGAAQDAQNVFELLYLDGWLGPDSLAAMKALTRFCDSVAHDDPAVPSTMPSIITDTVDDMNAFSSAILRRDAQQAGPIA